MLTIQQRAFLLEHVFLNGGKYTETVQRKFAKQFPEAQLPHRNTVRNLISKFRKTGDVDDAYRPGRPPNSEEKSPQQKTKVGAKMVIVKPIQKKKKKTHTRIRATMRVKIHRSLSGLTAIADIV